MRRSAFLLVLASSAAARADDGDAAARAFVEVTSARPTCYVGERVRLRLRVGYDEAFFRDHGVALYRRTLDLPVHVRAGLDALPSARVLPPSEAGPASDARRVTIALDDDVVAADRGPDVERGGRRLASLDVETSLVFDAPGEVRIDAPTLRFAWASRFEDDLVAGDVPLDRRDVTVAGAPLALRVLPLPEEGRPAGFTGAVGSFTVEADANPRDVAVGEPVRLVLRIRGDGDLAGFETPRLADLAGLEGFHVLGALDDRDARTRTIAWDLAPVRDGALEVPPIAFPVFDPEPPAGYRVLSTNPIPLVVRRAARGPEGTEPVRERGDEASGPSPLLVGALAAAAAGVLVVVLTRLRSLRGSAAGADPRAAPASLAAAALLGGKLVGTDEVAAAFADYLAARLGCPPGAVVSPDLGRRLEAAGVASELAARTAEAMDALTAARYGRGRDASTAAPDVRALVLEIEAAFEPAARGV